LTKHIRFRVFTENFDSWWPRAHHIGKLDMKMAIEPRPNADAAKEESSVLGCPTTDNR